MIYNIDCNVEKKKNKNWTNKITWDLIRYDTHQNNPPYIYIYSGSKRQINKKKKITILKNEKQIFFFFRITIYSD